MARRYTPDQFSQVVRQSNAATWEELVDFLEQRGGESFGLSNDQMAELEDDLEKMKDRGEPFNADPSELYQMIDSIQPTRTTIGPGSPTPESEAR